MTPCAHFDEIREVVPQTDGCEECLAAGDDWKHLRLCMTCGHVGCCDDSRNKHATKHFHSTNHPVIKSLEKGESWMWCYIDEAFFAGEAESDAQFDADVELPTAGAGPIKREAGERSFLSRGNIMSRPAGSRRPGGTKGMFSTICGKVRHCNRVNLEPVIELAVEIAREGREGRRIGTLFTFGDAASVLEHSRPLILDPLAGHPDEARDIRDQNLRGTIKELAQLDGAFVVSDEGIVISACRYLDAVASDVVLPYGMGSRHLAGGSISQATNAIAIVVSESSMVRVFDDGQLIAEIIPELWLMDRYTAQLPAPYKEELVGDLAVLTTSTGESI
ncbi:MAG: diadenylate cyclase [Pyrinomonadaceae bacterium]